MKASRDGRESDSASDPAVVSMRSAVSMLSFSSTGTPNSTPCGAALASSCAASRAASGFTSSSARSAGPWTSRAAMRAT